jgi:AP-1-like transcription factor
MEPPTNNRAGMPDFILSPHQQELLLAALSSNKPFLPNTQPLSDSGTLSVLDDNPLVEYDYDFDTNGGYDDFGDAPQGQLLENLLPDGDADIHDKRSHPDDQENDDGGGKRREGDDRSSKKPGRKPLTSEPTSVSPFHNVAADCHLMPQERNARHKIARHSERSESAKKSI